MAAPRGNGCFSRAMGCFLLTTAETKGIIGSRFFGAEEKDPVEGMFAGIALPGQRGYPVPCVDLSEQRSYLYLTLFGGRN
jgi:hypothetical protein